jgi:hypothetical protein
MFPRRCHVRINGTPNAPGVPRGWADHLGTDEPIEGACRIRGTKRSVQPVKIGIDEGGTVFAAHPGGTDCVRPPTTTHRSRVADHRPTHKIVPATAVRPY